MSEDGSEFCVVEDIRRVEHDRMATVFEAAQEPAEEAIHQDSEPSGDIPADTTVAMDIDGDDNTAVRGSSGDTPLRHALEGQRHGC